MDNVVVDIHMYAKKFMSRWEMAQKKSEIT